MIRSPFPDLRIEPSRICTTPSLSAISFVVRSESLKENDDVLEITSKFGTPVFVSRRGIEITQSDLLEPFCLKLLRTEAVALLREWITSARASYAERIVIRL